MKKFETLLKSEIKKAEAAANKFSGRTDCKVTAYSSKKSDIDAGSQRKLRYHVWYYDGVHF